VTARIYTPSGTLSGSKTQNIAVPAGSKKSADFELAIEKPLLWDSDHANLFDQRGRGEAGKTLDQKEDTFGNRKDRDQ